MQKEPHAWELQGCGLCAQGHVMHGANLPGSLAHTCSVPPLASHATFRAIHMPSACLEQAPGPVHCPLPGTAHTHTVPLRRTAREGEGCA